MTIQVYVIYLEALLQFHLNLVRKYFEWCWSILWSHKKQEPNLKVCQPCIIKCKKIVLDSHCPKHCPKQSVPNRLFPLSLFFPCNILPPNGFPLYQAKRKMFSFVFTQYSQNLFQRYLIPGMIILTLWNTDCFVNTFFFQIKSVARLSKDHQYYFSIMPCQNCHLTIMEKLLVLISEVSVLHMFDYFLVNFGFSLSSSLA